MSTSRYRGNRLGVRRLGPNPLLPGGVQAKVPLLPKMWGGFGVGRADYAAFGE